MSNPSVEQDSWVSIAVVLRARGNRGEVAADSWSDFPERFDDLKTVWLWKPGQARRKMAIEEVWWHQDRLVFKFAGIDSISDAETLAGHEVQVPESDRVPLPEGEYYPSDLVGFVLLDTASGETIGTVQSWTRSGLGPALLVVDDAETGEELLVPLVSELCQVKFQDRQIMATLPEGLRGLNRP